MQAIPDLSVSVAALLLAAVSCDAASAQSGVAAKTLPRNDARRLAPLAPGAEWTWRRTVGRGRVETIRRRCLRAVRTKSGTAWEVRGTHNGRPLWEYWDVRRAGVHRFDNRFSQHRRGVPLYRSAALLVPGPVGITTSWKWQEDGRAQARRDRPRPSKAELRRHYSGRLLGVAEPIEVPAGKFRATKIEIKMVSDYHGKTVETLWFAPDVGLVKRVLVQLGRGDRVVDELVRFRPGGPARVTLDARIKTFLAGEPRLAERGEPTAVHHLSSLELEPHVGSRFHLVRWKVGDEESSVLLRSFRDTIVVFRPDAKADWNALVEQEAEEMEHDGGSLANAYGVLSQLCVDPDSAPGMYRGSYSNKQSGMICQIWIRTGKAKGSKKVGWVRLTFEKGKVVELESTIEPH